MSAIGIPICVGTGAPVATRKEVIAASVQSTGPEKTVTSELVSYVVCSFTKL